MNNGSNIDKLDLYFKRKKNIIKTADHLILKMPMTKVNINYNPYITRNEQYKTLSQEQKDERHLLKTNNYQQKNNVKTDKYKKLLLPSLFITNSPNKNILNNINSTNKKSNNRNTNRKVFKIKKINFHSLSPTCQCQKNSEKTYNDNKLRKLYNEDFRKKRLFENYKKLMNKNIMSFSFEKYNNTLLQLSYIDISKKSYRIYKKNMIHMEIILNGTKTHKIKFNKFWERFNKNTKNENKTKNKSLSLSNIKTYNYKI